jgi:hypothetical protein
MEIIVLSIIGIILGYISWKIIKIGGTYDKD